MHGLFFGIPVTLEEAYRIFGVDIENVKQEIVLKHKCDLGMYHTIQAHLNDYMYTYLGKKAVKLNVISTDKGQHIIGYRIEEDISAGPRRACSDADSLESVATTERMIPPWNRFKNMDDFIVLLVDLNKLFYEEIAVCNADLSVVTLEIMEGEPEVAKNPIPYIISF